MDHIKPNIAIAVVTYDRVDALKRVLKSLNQARFPNTSEIPLIISIDGGGDYNVVKVAEEFDWKYGTKQVIKHSSNLGLKEHILKTGDLTEVYEHLLILEDDMFVAPNFYSFLQQASKKYNKSEKISGISLYSYEYNDHAGLPFIPLRNQFDIYFMQVPSSLGQLFQRDVWVKFKEFLLQDQFLEEFKMPESVAKWPESSWKKFFYAFMVKNDLYFVYPYNSLATNFCDAGTHFHSSNNWFQVSIPQLNNVEFRLPDLEQSEFVYDAFYEPLIRVASIHGIPIENIEIDLNGLKDLRRTEKSYGLSIKKTQNSICSYSSELFPPIMNALSELEGDVFYLSPVESFEDQAPVESKYALLLRHASFAAEKLISNGRKIVLDSTSFKLGNTLLKPFFWLRR